MTLDQSANPYLSLGLASNPFLAEPTPGVPQNLWIERNVLAPPQPGERRLVQLLGEKGAGKTSLLLHWRRAQPGPYHYVPPTVGRWRPPPTGAIVYWDELDRLPRPLRWVAWRWMSLRRGTIVAGTHVDLTGEARRAGLAVETQSLDEITPTEVVAFAAVRIVAVRLPGTTMHWKIPSAVAAEIAHASGGSWRTAADRLHVYTAEQARATVQAK